MTPTPNPERTTDSTTAVRIFERFLKEHEFTYRYSHSGDKYKTVFCYITDKNGLEMRGIGKGFSKQSMASAIAEAIEHYYYETDSTAPTPLPVNSEISGFWYYEGSPDFQQILQNKNTTLGHYSYSSFDGSSIINYPAFLGNPSYKPRTQEESIAIERFSLMRYSCNSGTASGLTSSESDLHATLEIIERDSIGILLLESIICKSPVKVRRIIKSSLPQNIEQKLRTIETDLNSKLDCYNITTDIGIPAYLTSLTTESGMRFFGSGASLTSEYALERSIVEAAQCVHAQKELNLRAPAIPRDELVKDLPKHMRCNTEKGIFLPTAGYCDVNYHDIKLVEEKSNLDLSLLSLNRLLENKGFRTYKRQIVDPKKHGISVSQVVIPNLERFFLVSCGLHILPSKRGRERINQLEKDSDNNALQTTCASARV